MRQSFSIIRQRLNISLSIFEVLGLYSTGGSDWLEVKNQFVCQLIYCMAWPAEHRLLTSETCHCLGTDSIEMTFQLLKNEITEAGAQRGVIDITKY